MNTLTAPVSRTPYFARAVTYRGFARDDGLWDIECQLLDTRDHAERRHEGPDLPAGAPAHDMLVRLTFDATLTVVNIEAQMSATPFSECQSAVPPMSQMIGAKMGRGWRKAVDDAIGGACGCTHLRELLYNLATPAIHTYTLHNRQNGGEDFHAASEARTAPSFIGRCVAWRLDSPLLGRTYPQFFKAESGAKPAAGHS
ncbi:MAG: DUF2889 domain-containing protein [Akkermansiaceae bacterium]|jgi:hypothetical protein|nr:DUF2889 domain-containing protein [Akkermansiaceae bacterium]